ncbi:Beta-1,4-galactosyltransferase [Winogradskyella psychrotolerans RS-3]|uniref:Beta-1,4-galactosyltransferase n=1 Tax=Winogradskyella psychrotolerans RS-3 TaxID=641526 RepID=S7VWW9_9FLAO|nr:glycosyltransferase family 25 protein [Winogradskyella psychrotolerans]EPR74765.1 Beta-1,4-galactosyltransferase [Winogradskyella psychrotolerans RS-3]
MQIFVVNLERDIERRASIEEQMTSLELPFDFFKAYYGKDLSSDELAIHYNAKRAYRNFSYPFPPAVIGCALSHVMLYKKMIADQIDYACIFEDDIILPPNTKKILQSIETVISSTEPQIILLSPSKSKEEVLHNLGAYQLRPFQSGFFTSSYIINQLGAKVLFENMYPVHHVADCWDYLKRHKLIDILAVNPTLIEQDQDTFGSSTTEGQNDQDIKKIASTLKYKVHRVFFKSLDYLVAFFNRNFKPYGGVKSK